MAKITYSRGIRHIRGAIDGFVYKVYADKRGTVVSRRPDMSRVRPSPKQLAQRAVMSLSHKLRRKAKSDESLRRVITDLAKKLGVNETAAAMALAQQRQRDTSVVAPKKPAPRSRRA